MRKADEVYFKLRTDIIRGIYVSGIRLSESELCESLSVSKTPLRNALARLALDDLVIVVPQSGTFVKPISRKLATQAQFIREHLECAIVEEIAKNKDVDFARVDRCLAQQELADRQGDREAFSRLDDEFHYLLSELANRTGVWKVISSNKLHLDRLRFASLPRSRLMTNLIEDHKAIIAALKARETQNAIDSTFHLH